MKSANIEDIMGQFFVALGQGTGHVRIQREAIREFRSRYLPRITNQMIHGWDTDGVQVLERVRAIGRLAAINVGAAGQISINSRALFDAMMRVEEESATVYCGVGRGVVP
jgi:hypothetical protein